jgi:hypothetical protein
MSPATNAEQAVGRPLACWRIETIVSNRFLRMALRMAFSRK